MTSALNLGILFDRSEVPFLFLFQSLLKSFVSISEFQTRISASLVSLGSYHLSTLEFNSMMPVAAEQEGDCFCLFCLKLTVCYIVLALT